MVITILTDFLNKKILSLVILYFAIVGLIVALFLPISGWGFYYSQVITNMYAWDFNLETSVGLPSKGIIVYLILMRSLSLICNLDPMPLAQIASMTSIFIVILSYVYILYKLVGKGKLVLAVALIYPFIVIIESMSYWFGYVLPFSLILMLLIISIILTKNEMKHSFQYSIILVLCWGALGLYWHSFQVLTYGIILFAFFISLLQTSKTELKKSSIIQFSFITILFAATWIYMRDQTVQQFFSISNTQFDISSIFNKGSFSGIYAYQKSATDPVWIIDYLPYINYLRYASYVLAFSILGIIAIKFILAIIKNEKPKKLDQIFVCLLFADIFFMISYYIATNETAPRILSAITLPLLIIVLLSGEKQNLPLIDLKVVRISIVIIFILSIFLLAPYSIYSYFEETPEKNIPIGSFKSSLIWNLEYTPQKTILSNSHTIGNYLLLYGSSTKWLDTKSISFKDMTHRDYVNIVSSNFMNQDKVLLIFNEKMYSMHLKQESIQYWNVYEPINPKYLTNNYNIQKIYCDGTISAFA